jgi:membrane associated rhomboid family serine protease
MGIHDRDYVRNDGRSLFDGVGRWGGTVWLIVATCAVFVVQLLTRDMGQDLTRAGVYSGRGVMAGEVWRLVAPMFLHDPNNLFGLAFNMLTLFWFGRRLEETYGVRRFVLFYLAAGTLGLVLTFLGQVAGLPLWDPPPGAGAAVTGVLVLYACNYPRDTVSLFGVLPLPAWVLAALFLALNLGFARTGALLYLVAAALGFVYYRTGSYGGTAWWPPAPRAARRPQLRVIRPEPPDEDDELVASEPRAAPATPDNEHLEAWLDGVLEKVSRDGRQSLTPEEREILFRASELYKRRRK